MGINDTKQCCSTDEKKSPPIYCYLGKDEWDTNNIFQTVTVCTKSARILIETYRKIIFVGHIINIIIYLFIILFIGKFYN